MENYKDLYEQAGKLMLSALECYKKGDIEEGNKLRGKANDLYGEAQTDADRNFNNIIYGENRNFGVIYNIIEANSKNLCEDKSKRKAFSNIVKLIRENKNLKSQFDFFNALTHPNGFAFNTEQYVNEALAITPKIDNKVASKENEKLISEIKKNNLDELIDIDDDTMALYESIEYLLFNKPTYANLAEYSNAKNNVVTYLDENINEEETTDSKDINEELNAIIEKYDSLLNEDEKKLIETVMNAEDKKSRFETYQQETIKKIENTLKDNDDKELKSICEEIKNKTYNKQTVLEDISEFIEIKNVLS